MNFTRQTELFGFIEFMVEDERTLLIQMPFYHKVLMFSVITLSILWANLMKIFIYFNLMEEKLTERPINVLILIDQVRLFLP